jgi:Flp pilus assembly protein TadD
MLNCTVDSCSILNQGSSKFDQVRNLHEIAKQYMIHRITLVIAVAFLASVGVGNVQTNGSDLRKEVPTSSRAAAGDNELKATIERSENVAVPLLQRETAKTTVAPPTLTSQVNQLYKQGYAAFEAGKLSSAKQLFNQEAKLAPAAVQAYYALGLIAQKENDDGNALANFAVAWYLQPNNKEYVSAYNASRLRMRSVADPMFASADYQAGDGKALLNLGVRLWKLGYTPAASTLFAWTASNVPAQSDVAYYDLGAIAESQHDMRLALQYYQAAANEFKLQGHDAMYKLYTAGLPANAPFPFAAVAVSEKQLNGTINSVRLKLNAADKSWKGWTQLRASGASSICPCCIIDRGENY